MSKIIAQAFFSMMVSLGLVAGASPDVRGEVQEAWQETKTTIQQTVDFAAETVSDLASQVGSTVSVEAGAEANTDTDVYHGEGSTEAQAAVEADAQAGTSVEGGSEDGFLINFGGDADTGLKINFGFWK
ncbi:MAG TPA: hypothetical protein DCX53_02345 [Anaerolineae bacterium]|nr:hypothetical protein [Anaerolineae bacterium]